MTRRPTLQTLAALAAALCCIGTAWGQAVPESLASRAAAVLKEVADAAAFNGAVVLMRDGRVVYEGAVGLAQRDPDRAYTTDTPSDGASLAKTMTAAAVWELVAEGRLKFDDPVVRHLPAYPYGNHTLRDLLTHRNGLPDYDFFDVDFKPGQVRDTSDLLAAIARRRPPTAMAPGVNVEYSNLGFDFAALIVERVSGQTIEAFWQERYFKRLGMRNTFARPARFADWPVARTPGYRQRSGRWELFDAIDGEGMIGASNVHASARDWARWGDAFAREQVMPRERLDAGLREPMLTSGMDNSLRRLSWYCSDDAKRCQYTGSYNGFFAQVYWDRARREVVAYVSNSTLAPWRCARLTRDFVDVLAERALTVETMPMPLRIDKKELARWAGHYAVPGVGPVWLSTSEDRLFVRVAQGELASVFQVTGAVFYAPTLDVWFAFSGTPVTPTLHFRSVFHAADAVRSPAPASRQS